MKNLRQTKRFQKTNAKLKGLHRKDPKKCRNKTKRTRLKLGIKIRGVLSDVRKELKRMFIGTQKQKK